MKDGTEVELAAGSLFYIPPVAHGSWVIGDEPYVSLHFLGLMSFTGAPDGSHGHRVRRGRTAVNMQGAYEYVEAQGG